MNTITVLLGVAACGYGLYTAWARKAKPQQFSKLEAMKKQWGERNGNAIHLFGYTIVPLLVGLTLIIKGMQGGSP